MENPLATPPPKITLNDSALLSYAVLDESVGYTVGHGLFFVDGRRLAKFRASQFAETGIRRLLRCTIQAHDS